MALRAFALLRTRFELAFVRVGFVAIHAIRKRQRPLEIAVQVALGAADRRVLAEQGILRFRMVEFEARQQLLPATRRVAVFAALLEGTLVGIHVAGRAGVKLHVLIARGSARHVGFMALLASNPNMQACQGIARLRVVKLLRGFPIREIVAAQAIVAELPFVRIFVARHAVLR